MAQPRARLGDSSDHGGEIISASSTVFAGGVPVARLGDLHACPIHGHGVTPIVSASDSVLAEGRPVARLGDSVGCGATIISGAPTVTAG